MRSSAVEKREDSLPALGHCDVRQGVPAKRDNNMPVRNEEKQSAAIDKDFFDAGPEASLPPGTIRRVLGGGHDIALINDGRYVIAVSDLCLRCSHPLSEGALASGLLVCAHCGWMYDLERGCVARLPSLKIDTYHVRIEDGQVHVHADSSSETEDRNRVELPPRA